MATIIGGPATISYTVTGTSKFIAQMTGVNAPIIKRPIHQLADGTALFVQIDENDSGSPWGTHDGVVKISLWQSDVDRTTWTKKVTYTLPAGTYPGGTFHAGSVLMLNESLYFVWRDEVGSTAPGYSLHGVVFAKSGATWTAPVATELLYQPATNGNYPFRLDLDINPVTGDIFIAWMFNALDRTTNTIGIYALQRKSSTVRNLLGTEVGLGNAGNVHPLTNSEDFSMAVDSSSDATTTRFVYIASASTTTKDYGDYLGWQVVRNSDSAVLGKGWLKQGLSAGRGAGRRTTYLFASAPGEFSLVGMGGTTSGEGYATRWKTVSAIGTAVPTWTNPIPINYTSTKYPMDRTNAIWTDVSVTYANGNFAIVYHTTAGVFNDIIGKFAVSTVLWETPAYSWDSTFAFGVRADADWRYSPAGAVFGGARHADSTNKHDTILVYFSRASMVPPTSSKPATWAHQFNRTWRAPAAVGPSNGSTVNTSVPVVSMNCDLDMPAPRSALVPYYEIASDAAFSADVSGLYGLPITVANTHRTGTTVHTASIWGDEFARPTGLWYIRGRQIDSFGTLGTFSPGNAFNVSHPPIGNNLAPAGAAIFTYGAGNVTFSWTFQDSYVRDSQSSWRVLIEINNDASTLVLDTGKTTGSENFATLAIPSTAKNTQLKWRVQLWDIDDNPGPLSAYGLFTIADPPIVTISTPASGAVIDNARPNVQWVTVDPLETGQISFRVYFLNQGQVITDSGWRNGADQAFTPDGILLENNKSYSVTVAVRDAAGLVSQSTNSFTTTWALPGDPDLSSLFLDVSKYTEVGGGYVRIIWENVTADPEFLSWRLYRRYQLKTSVMIGDKGQAWELLHEEFNVSPPGNDTHFTYLDYTAPSGYEVHYILTQTAVRFGSIVESRHPSLTDMGRLASLYSGNYWLIKPGAAGFPEDVIRLESASADSYTEEYETAEVQLIGRGRHVEIGDRLGYSGQLTLQLRFIAGSGALDDPRRQKLDLERFKAERSEVWIRSPFGDLFMASTGDMQFERMPGVGQTEFTTVTLPYKEVYVA